MSEEEDTLMRDPLFQAVRINNGLVAEDERAEVEQFLADNNFEQRDDGSWHRKRQWVAREVKPFAALARRREGSSGR